VLLVAVVAGLSGAHRQETPKMAALEVVAQPMQEVVQEGLVFILAHLLFLAQDKVTMVALVVNLMLLAVVVGVAVLLVLLLVLQVETVGLES
jgi:hypothetical protein